MEEDQTFEEMHMILEVTGHFLKKRWSVRYLLF